MATLKKVKKKRKFVFQPTLHDPEDLVAISSTVFGGLRGRASHCASISIHERHDEFGHKPGRHVATIELDAEEVKKLLQSLVLTQIPSDLNRVIETAKEKRRLGTLWRSI